MSPANASLGPVMVSTPTVQEINDALRQITARQDAMRVTSTYAVTGVTTDRTFDASATTANELANVLATLITDLRASGVLR